MLSPRGPEAAGTRGTRARVRSRYCDEWGSIDECPINNDLPELIKGIGADMGLEVVDTQQAFVDAFGADPGSGGAAGRFDRT